MWESYIRNARNAGMMNSHPIDKMGDQEWRPVITSVCVQQCVYHSPIQQSAG